MLTPARASADEPDTTTAASPPVEHAVPPPPPPGGTPTVELPTTPEEAAAAASAEVKHVVVGGGGHVAFGSAPGAALGLRISTEVVTGRWSLAVEGRYDFPASGDTARNGTARASLVGGALVPCMRARALWACAVVLLSRVESEASERDGTRVTNASFFLGLGGRLQAHFALGESFAIRLSGDALVQPIPYELRAHDQRLFKSSVVSITVGPTLVHVF